MGSSTFRSMTYSFTATVRTANQGLKTIEFESISQNSQDAKIQCESMTGGEVVMIKPTNLS